MRSACYSWDLGRVPYPQALELQGSLVERKALGFLPGVILLLEHPPVFTMGRFRGKEAFLVPVERLLEEGISVYESDRGGSVTYHGLGQLVAYPVLSLREVGLGLPQYIWCLEEVAALTLRAFGLRGHRVPGAPGVWVGEEKVCSLGLHITRGITKHGLALNVNTDLRYFDYILPCGLAGVRVTSMARLLGKELAMEEVKEKLLGAFSQVFPFTLERVDPCLLLQGVPLG